MFKAALGLAAGLGAVVALALNYRRHRIEESQSHRDDQRLFTDRFQSATEQLGQSQPAVRLAGVHALARLADDWFEQRQTCIDVLCAYMRMPPIDSIGRVAPDLSKGGDGTATPTELGLTIPPAEREVRQTIVRLIASRLRAPGPDRLTISWCKHDFDFTGAIFDGVFAFKGARFVDGVVSFDNAKFSRGQVSFDGARFLGGIVSFNGATFCGGRVLFGGAKFGRYCCFRGLTVSGVDG